MADGPWEPKTRKDYVDMFADALGTHTERETEKAEKAKADAAKNTPAPPETPPAPRTIQERILGIKRTPPAT